MHLMSNLWMLLSAGTCSSLRRIHEYIIFQRSRWPLQVNRGHTAPRTSRLPRYGSRARLPGGRHGSHSQPLRTTGVIVAMLPRMWDAPTFTRKCTVDILCIFNRSFLRFLLYLLFFDVFLFIYDIIVSTNLQCRLAAWAKSHTFVPNIH